jgi:hypothetical protein
MWREAGLEEPGASAANGAGLGGGIDTDRNVDVAEARMLATSTPAASSRATGGEPNGPRPTVIPPHTTGGEPIEAKRPQGCHTTGGGTGKGAEGGEGK